MSRERNTVLGNSNGESGQIPQAEAISTVAVSEPQFVELSAILGALHTMRDGNFSVRLPGSWTGLPGKIADAFNEIVAANQQMTEELRRVGQVVGKEGKTRERTRFHESCGAWGEMETSVNTLIEDLLRPTTEVTRAIGAVAQGNLTQTVRLDVDGRPLEGEFLRSANIVNTMIQQLGVFTAEVTRVAREMGTDGKLGGQAVVPGVAGTWKDLTDNVNVMAANLTEQVRGIVPVVPEVLRAKVNVFADLHRKSRQLESLNAELRSLSGSLIASQDEERRRIARQLHDELGQDLVAAKMMMDSIVRCDSAQAVEQAATNASKLVDAAIQQIRSLSHLLHPPLLDEVGLRSALQWYVEGVAKSSGIAITLDMEVPDFPRPAPELERAIFRIVQEALTNVFRHSDANKGVVTVNQRNGQVFVSVRDYGKGIGEQSGRPQGIGVGIRGMKQRASELGGELRIIDAHPGTLVEVVLPYKTSVPQEASAAF